MISYSFLGHESYLCDSEEPGVGLLHHLRTMFRRYH